MSKIRLDVLLAERGFAESRSQAQRLVMAGQVRVNGQTEARPDARVLPDAAIEIDTGPRFVSRGGEKLEAALRVFGIDVRGKACADVGASTGGFTDCLLQFGAQRVYAIDVGYGVLHWKLRKNPQVISMERTNVRYVESLPEKVDLVTVDASFISLKLILPVFLHWFPESGGEVVALIKPQFEAGKSEVDRGEGVIQDPRIHREVLLQVLSSARDTGYDVRGLIRSPLRGPKGNTEFLAWLGFPAREPGPFEVWIDEVIRGAGSDVS